MENENINNEIMEAEQTYLRSLQQFGETNSHNAATFENLSNANQNLVSNMAMAIQQLNMQVQGLANAVQATQMRGPTGHNPAPQQYQTPTYQPPTYQPPPQQYQPPQQVPYQPQPQYQGAYNRPPAYSGRGRGRGRTNGRGRAGGRTANQGRYNNQYRPQNTYNPQGQNQMYQTGYNQGGQNFNPYSQQQNEPYSNTTKYYKNWNYCHSCGYDVEDNHTSQTCPNPKPTHVWTATRTNPCGGCRKGMHKINM